MYGVSVKLGQMKVDATCCQRLVLVFEARLFCIEQHREKQFGTRERARQHNITVVRVVVVHIAILHVHIPSVVGIVTHSTPAVRVTIILY